MGEINTKNTLKEPQYRDIRLRRALFSHLRHEFRTPINAIIGYSEMLLEDISSELTEIYNDLEKILHAGKLLTQMIDELFDEKQIQNEHIALDLEHFKERVADDLRTPLNAVIGYSEMLLEDFNEPKLKTFIPDLEKINQAGKILLHQIMNLVDISKVTANEIELDLMSDSSSDSSTMVDDMLSTFDELQFQNNNAELTNTKILVVDDNEMNRDLLSRYLEREGYRIFLAEDGEKALEELQKNSFDLIFLDILMPVMNGFELLKQLKSSHKWQHIPVIMLSALAEKDHVAQCLEMGAEDYLLKPFEPIILKARTRSSLEKKKLRDRECIYLRQIEEEKERSDQLLHVIFPPEIVKELKDTQRIKPRRYDGVAVLFCDIVGFTPYCEERRPEEVLLYLQELVDSFEKLALQHGLLKIKTIGDAFMATAGLLQPSENPVLDCAMCGLDMISKIQQLPAGWNARVGIHVGSVVAGVVGHRQFSFDLWGDTVNTAARVESHGDPAAVNLSAKAWENIAPKSRGESKGIVNIKGKGSMEIFRYLGPKK